jgi:SAM-dependent methyltransferase
MKKEEVNKKHTRTWEKLNNNSKKDKWREIFLEQFGGKFITHGKYVEWKDFPFSSLGVEHDWFENDNEDWSPPDDPIYDFFRKHYDGEEVVLEIGCLHGGSFERTMKTIPNNNIKKAFLVDLNEKAIEQLNENWGTSNPFGFEIEAHANDGLHLNMIPSGVIDFVFSFHTLKGKHCSVRDVMPSYVSEMKRVLKPNGKYLINTWFDMPHEKKYEYEPFNGPPRDEVFFGYRENL